jgi:hypothetical protein
VSLKRLWIAKSHPLQILSVTRSGCDTCRRSAIGRRARDDERRAPGVAQLACSASALTPGRSADTVHRDEKLAPKG